MLVSPSVTCWLSIMKLHFTEAVWAVDNENSLLLTDRSMIFGQDRPYIVTRLVLICAKKVPPASLFRKVHNLNVLFLQYFYDYAGLYF